VRRILPGLLLALGCSDGLTGPGDTRGTFHGRLSNAIARDVVGEARYFVFGDQSSSEYRIELGPATSAKGFSLTILGDGPRLAVGTYTVVLGPGPSPQPPTVFADACVDTTQTCFSLWRVGPASSDGAGRLEITRSAPGGLAGHLEVDLLGDGAVTGMTLHVAAKFYAACDAPTTC
jgi:hypothetical protein